MFEGEKTRAVYCHVLVKVQNIDIDIDKNNLDIQNMNIGKNTTKTWKLEVKLQILLVKTNINTSSWN